MLPGFTVINLIHVDLERVPSLDGKSSNDRFRCTVCVQYGSDDELGSFSRNNKAAHIRTEKHRLALGVRARKLAELTKTPDDRTPSQPIHSVLLPMPEISPTIPAGQGNTSVDIFGSVRRFGLTYLDKNGEKLEFSAGMISDDDRGYPVRSEEVEASGSECLDSESDMVDPRPKWPARDVEQRDYWPYPSKTVGGTCEMCRNLLTNHSDAFVGCN